MWQEQDRKDITIMRSVFLSFLSAKLPYTKSHNLFKFGLLFVNILNLSIKVETSSIYIEELKDRLENPIKIISAIQAN